MSVNNFRVQGNLQFEDGTIQSTNNVVIPPDTLVGKIGDKNGMIAYDGDYIYYCFSDYEPLLSYTLIFYLHHSQTGYTFTDVHGNDLNNWFVISANTELDGELTIPPNTTINTWVYADNGSIIEWTHPINELDTDSVGPATMTVAQYLNPINIWVKISFKNILSTDSGIDLTKNVQKMPNDDEYILEDGIEGQIMYFTSSGATVLCKVKIANLRIASTIVAGNWYPFESSDLSIALFTDGAWNVKGGLIV